MRASSAVAELLVPRCIEYQRGLAIRKVSLCPSVTRVHYDKTEKNLSRFLYHTKEHLA